MSTNAIAEKIEGTDEAWETRQLGANLESAAVSTVDPQSILEALGLKPISIRLEQELIDDFKAIAHINGMPYQTLMREVLRRFAEGEKKRIAIECDNQKIAQERASEIVSKTQRKQKARKVA